MNKKIIKLAEVKFKNLLKKYDGFCNIILDDWRGYRLIYDCIEVRNCKNQCQQCQLYKLLKNEKKGDFTANLYQASSKDKKIFGKQNFLNCKTLKEYQNCYINFLNQKNLTNQEIKSELKLIKNLKIIYSKEENRVLQEKIFKKSLINQLIKATSGQKKEIIKNYAKKNIF